MSHSITRSSESNTPVAIRSVSSLGRATSGTQATGIPAATAARTPASLSSSTSESSAAAPVFSRVFRKISGAGLPLFTSGPKVKKSKHPVTPF